MQHPAVQTVVSYVVSDSDDSKDRIVASMFVMCDPVLLIFTYGMYLGMKHVIDVIIALKII